MHYTSRTSPEGSVAAQVIERLKGDAQPHDNGTADEGDGWVDWSGLATLLADIGRVVSNRWDRLLG